MEMSVSANQRTPKRAKPLEQLAAPAAIDEEIVVGELQKRPLPDLAHRPDLAEHLVDRLLAVAGPVQARPGAELAAVRAAARGLDRDAVVVLRIEQAEPRDRRLPQVVERAGGGAVDAIQTAAAQVLDHPRPERLGLAQHYRVGVFQRLVRQRRHVRPAEDYLRPPGSKLIGQRVGLADLGRVGGDRDGVEIGQPPGVQVGDVWNLDVLDLDVLGRQGRQSQQRQAWQRGDDVSAGDELRQGHAQPGQLRVDDAHSAHGQQAESHGSSPRGRHQPPPGPGLDRKRHQDAGCGQWEEEFQRAAPGGGQADRRHEKPAGDHRNRSDGRRPTGAAGPGPASTSRRAR